jgi:TetR/AcrR family transcriptional regulator, cholesterol catabolism regulator
VVPRANRWDDIRQAAAEEFRDRGFESATLESIAARVGLHKGSLYHYIETKDELLFAVVELPANRLLERLEELVEQDAPAAGRLRELFQLQVRVFTEHYPAAFVYLQQLGRPNHRSDFQARDRRYVEALTALISDGVRRGEFVLPTSPRIAALAVIGALDWMHHWYRPEGALADTELAGQLFSLSLGGLLAGGPLGELLDEVPSSTLVGSGNADEEIVT